MFQFALSVWELIACCVHDWHMTQFWGVQSMWRVYLPHTCCMLNVYSSWLSYAACLQKREPKYGMHNLVAQSFTRLCWFTNVELMQELCWKKHKIRKQGMAQANLKCCSCRVCRREGLGSPAFLSWACCWQVVHMPQPLSITTSRQLASICHSEESELFTEKACPDEVLRNR